jgi:ABC-2 type transport system ATP-binding protein
MIQVTNLTKRYGSTLALDGLTLTVPSGAVFGLLGPNGSGKSTFMKLLMRFIFPDEGEMDRGSLATHQIGYLPERIFFPMGSRIAEYLLAIGELGGLGGGALRERVDTVLRHVGLNDVSQLRIRACSKGMLQRLGLAQALLDDPPFLLLDEPMGGLDPAWQRHLRDLIRLLHGEGKTILLSTHRLSEVAELCTHVAILRQGRLVRSGALAEVLPARPQLTIAVSALPSPLHDALRTLHPSIVVQDGLVTLRDDAIQRKPEVLRLLLDSRVDIRHLEQQRTTLEEVYLEALHS